MNAFKRLVTGALIGAAALASTPARPQGYPTRPVTLVVPYSPGGSIDGTARTLAQKLAEALGQQVLVDNRAGAGAKLGAQHVARSAADGYTLLVTTTGLAMTPSLSRNPPFNAAQDFTPISQIASSYLVLAINAQTPARTLKEFVELVKAQPGKFNYGHTGVGNVPQLLGEMMRLSGRLDVVGIPFKGEAGVLPSLMTNEVQFSFLTPGAVAEHVRAGKLRVLASTSSQRDPALPDVPTVSELGFPDATYDGWVAIFGPSGLPGDVAERVAREADRIVKTPEVSAKLRVWGFQAVGGTPKEFSQKYLAEIGHFQTVLRKANVPMLD